MKRGVRKSIKLEIMELESIYGEERKYKPALESKQCC